MSETTEQNPPYTYGTEPSQPNYNAPAPIFLQNAPQPLPANSATPTTQVWAVPTVAPQWGVGSVVAPNTGSAPSFYQTFLKSKPTPLGIVLIVSAILEIALEISLFFSTPSITSISGISFWGSIFYIVAGSLTIAAQSKPNLCLVKGSLALNIISSVFSVIAVILNIVDLAVGWYYIYSKYFKVNMRAVVAILLVLNLLVFCVSLSISIFGCRSLSEESTSSPQMFVIQNGAVFATNPSAVPVASSGFAQPYPPATTPPPYIPQQVKAFPAS
ncbi:membrane-spanning 4-domains subfamily A member 4D-like [Eleutherodactylus coqui]|uniref:membrane-spanning 4-domains subfamily A member 4D-like n=1 Tax=Eleutherodactylus coqui TaxID=57060 RepID=UPI00346311AB